MLDGALNELSSNTKNINDTIGAQLQAADYMALHAQKDMSWKKASSSEHRDKAIEALNKEITSLENSILTLIPADHVDYDTAVDQDTPGRILLDIKRNGTYKARGVKQGFKEDKASADGPDFNYYGHVEQGFIRGENEPCVYHHPDRDLLLLLYVDDVLADGEETDIQWFSQAIDLLPANSIKIAESGIFENTQLEFIESLGYDAALIGTNLMKTGEPGRALAHLLQRDML